MQQQKRIVKHHNPYEHSQPFFLFAQGSLLTALATPLSDADAPLQAAPNSAVRSFHWREVDMTMVTVASGVEDVPFALPGDEPNDGGRRTCPKPQQYLGLTPPDHFPGEALLAPTTVGTVPSDDKNSLWHANVTAHFRHGTTEYDVTTTSLKGILELLVLKHNMTAYDMLMSPMVFVTCAKEGAALLTELQTVILPSLVVKETLAAAVRRGLGIMASEAPLLKKNKQVEGRNVSATVHNHKDTKAIFMRSKGFCIAIWTMMRAVLVTTPATTLREDAESATSGNATTTLSTSHQHQRWINEFTFDGLLARVASARPHVLAKVTVADVVAASAVASPVGVGLDGRSVRSAARAVRREAVMGDHNTESEAGHDDLSVEDDDDFEEVFPVLQYIHKVAALRKRRGVDVGAAEGDGEASLATPSLDPPTKTRVRLPPLFCDLLLMSLVKCVASNCYSAIDAACKISAMSEPTTTSRGGHTNIHRKEVPIADMKALNAFLNRVATGAATAD